MNIEKIYQIRENKNIYLYLKYNSYLYKKIFRNEITIKELDNLSKQYFKKTPTDKLKTIQDKIEFANTFLDLLK